jgi:hypothetical protein
MWAPAQARVAASGVASCRIRGCPMREAGIDTAWRRAGGSALPLLAAAAGCMPDPVHLAEEEAVARHSGQVRGALARQAAAPLRQSAQRQRRHARDCPAGTLGFALAGQLYGEGAPTRRSGAPLRSAQSTAATRTRSPTSTRRSIFFSSPRTVHSSSAPGAPPPPAAAAGLRASRRPLGGSAAGAAVQGVCLTPRGFAAALPSTGSPVLRLSVLLRPSTQAKVLLCADVCAGTRVRLSGAHGPRRRGVRVLGLHADKVGLGAHHLRVARRLLSWTAQTARRRPGQPRARILAVPGSLACTCDPSRRCDSHALAACARWPWSVRAASLPTAAELGNQQACARACPNTSTAAGAASVASSVFASAASTARRCAACRARACSARTMHACARRPASMRAAASAAQPPVHAHILAVSQSLYQHLTGLPADTPRLFIYTLCMLLYTQDSMKNLLG